MNSYRRHQWWTVSGGSIEYVRRITKQLTQAGVNIHLNSRVEKVLLSDKLPKLLLEDGSCHCFDEVVLACHADHALELIAGATQDQRSVLGAFRFQSNLAVLHQDASQMPKRFSCWSSWNVKIEKGMCDRPACVTYWMNRLQNIPISDPLFVTLNPVNDIPEQLVYDTCTFRHPILDRNAVTAQVELDKIQGRRGVWFCGAWTSNGFHEDGASSAISVASHIKKKWET